MKWLKRHGSPNTWRIKRKMYKFVVRPMPGAYNFKNSIPLGVLLRDYLMLADNLKETKKILNQRIVKINGRIKKDVNFSVGFTDILEIGDTKYFVSVSKKGFKLVKFTGNKRLCKIIDKKTIKNNKIQYIFHDGRTMISDKKYTTNGTVVIDITKNSIVDFISLEKGNLAFVYGGANTGNIGKISEINVTENMQPKSIVIDIDNVKKKILFKYILVIGKDKPLISGVFDDNE